MLQQNILHLRCRVPLKEKTIDLWPTKLLFVGAHLLYPSLRVEVHEKRVVVYIKLTIFVECAYEILSC